MNKNDSDYIIIIRRFFDKINYHNIDIYTHIFIHVSALILLLQC
jgi:hypothetical protein